MNAQQVLFKCTYKFPIYLLNNFFFFLNIYLFTLKIYILLLHYYYYYYYYYFDNHISIVIFVK